MRRELVKLTFVLALCLGILSSPALADYKNFGIYQDTNGDGILNPGDTYIGGFMSWYTHDSAASSYNYNQHTNAVPDPQLIGKTDLPGAPWASDFDNHDPSDPRTWLPMHEDELHMYLAWSNWDNAPEQSGENIGGFALGMIANNYVNSKFAVPPQASGGYLLDIAVRNDSTTVPGVTLSDDYTDGTPPTGRPEDPLIKNDGSQELYKIADPGGTEYNHHFQGRWDYTALHSTADGGVIGGIHNGDYDIDIDPSKIVTSKLGDGLVIRIDPQAFDKVDKIVLYDFGYFNGAIDTTGDPMPANYVGHTSTWGPLGIEIPIISDREEGYQAFFIASIPEVVPEPATLLTLLVSGAVAVLARRRTKK